MPDPNFFDPNRIPGARVPSSNMPDPDKIPDMSLGESTERPTSIQPAPDATSFQSNIDPPRPSPVPQKPNEEPAPKQWQEGDDVLAPWEPTMLYPGTIKQIAVDDARGDQALIAFDDGGEGWVFLYSLCPFEFKAGQRVEVRRNNGQTYYPAEILQVADAEARVRYDNGNTEWTGISNVRVPCIANGPAAVPTRFASWQTPYTASSAAAGGTGVPTWVIWIGIGIVLAIIRVGCRSAMQN